MPRTIKEINQLKSIPDPVPASSSTPPVPIVLIPLTYSAGVNHHTNFQDGSINYFGTNLKQTFRYVLVDNIGTGKIRISYNRPDMGITTPVIGSKTLSSLDSIYLEEDIWDITIYFIEASTVEIVAKAFKDDT